jgi:hypothetical protein
MTSFLPRRTRLYLYSLAIAIVPLLLAYDAIEPDTAPLWLGLAATFLGIAAPATALANLNDDPNAAHWEDDLDATESEVQHENG